MNQNARAILQGITRRDPDGFVFPGREGAKRENFRRMARRVKERAGLPADFRPVHGLRHHFASHLVSAGVEIYAAQKLLTHEKHEMTQRYAHLADEAIKKAALVADRIFTPKKGVDSENDS